MTTKKLIIALCLYSLSMSLYADNICVDGLYYQITSDSTVQVAYSENRVSYQGEIIIPATIDYAEKTYKVTAIGSSAFSGCYQITNIIIGDNVDSIYNYAFKSCSALKSVTFGKNVKCLGGQLFDYSENVTSIIWNARHCNDLDKNKAIFSNGGYLESNITEFIIGDEVEYLPYKLCRNMTGLTELVIPQSVKEISSSVFLGCTSLKSIAFSEGLVKIGVSAFQKCSSLTELSLPNSLVTIDNYAFEDCTSLKSINIPINVTSIGKSVFDGCSSISKIKWEAKYCSDFNQNTSFVLSISNNINSQLESFELGDEVEYIPAYLCNGLTEFTELNIPNSVKAIGAYAFAAWKALRILQMSDRIESIGAHAFENCTRLNNITLPNTISYIGTDAFKNTGWANGTTGWESGVRYLGSALIETNPEELGTECVVKANTTSIGAYAFQNCSNLTSITLPESTTAINEYAFLNCTSLHKILVPDNVKSVQDGAFYKCSNLENIKVGRQVEKFGDYAFYGCTSLKRVEISDLSAWCNISFGKQFSYDIQGYTSNPVCYTGHLYLGEQEIVDLIIPDDVISINSLVFYRCNNIKNVTIHDHLTSMGKNAFEGCNNIAGVYINDLSSWCNIAFDSNPLNGTKLYLNNEEVIDLIIPQDVDSISHSAFFNCKSIKHVTFNDNLKEIGYDAFYGSNIEEVQLPNNILKIGKSSFSKCGNLSKVSLGVELKEIAPYAFSECPVLESVVLSDSTLFIGERAFYLCPSLKSVRVNPSLREITSYAFGKCSGLKDFEFPRNLYYVWENAFSECGLERIQWNAINCEDFYYLYDNSASTPFYDYGVNMGKATTDLRTQIKSITFGKEVKHIPAHLCHGLKEITTITLGNSIESIGDGAFSGCANLESLSLGNSINEIGDKICQSCPKLISIYSYMRIPPTIDANSFGLNSYKGVDLYVPYGCKNTYLEHEIWKDFYLIEGLPDIEEEGLFYMLNMSESTAELVPAPSVRPYSGNIDSISIPSYILCGDEVYTVSSIAKSTFKNANLTGKVYLPCSLEQIGDSAFYGTDITDLYFYEDVKDLNGHFRSRRASASDYIQIGEFCFAQIKSLKAIHAIMETPPVITANVFKDSGLLNAIKLFVPENLLETYRNASIWNEFDLRKEAVYYTVVFKDWDGTILDTQEVESGQAAIEPTNPSRDGYIFIGWDKECSNVLMDMIIYAQYEANSTSIESIIQSIQRPNKIFLNGHLYIHRDGKTYTVMGAEVR